MRVRGRVPLRRDRDRAHNCTEDRKDGFLEQEVTETTEGNHSITGPQ